MRDIDFQRQHVIWILAVTMGILAWSAAGSGGEDGSGRGLRKMALAACCERDPGKDFNTLGTAGNHEPEGIWSDGTTMWVADDGFADTEKIYAYAMATTVRDSAKDFNTLDDAGNGDPEGIWSDGTTMWVGDDPWLGEKIYAYVLATKARDSAKDIDEPEYAGNDNPEGIWSDGTTMWVADHSDEKLYAYTLATGARDRSKEFNTLDAAGNDHSRGIWSDGTTMWVADSVDDKIYAYSMTSKARDPDRDFNTLEAAGNGNPTGIWSDGRTMWVADDIDDKIYAYNMPSQNASQPGAPGISSVTAGRGSFTVTWTAPASGAAVTAYDLRYIRSDATDKADPNWTVEEDFWRAGSGTLSYELTGLTGGVQYDVQVRAVSGSNDGAWSPTHTVTTLVQGRAATDFNGDGRTDFIDFFLFADAYGGTDARFDLDGSGRVDFADFFKFVDAFGS